MRKALAMAAALVVLAGSSSHADWKTVVHLSTLPVIEGAGIYSAARMLSVTDDSYSKTTAIVSLAALGTQATLGIFKLVGLRGKLANPEALTRAHRLVAYAVAVSAVAMSIAAATDKDVSDTDKGIAYAYNGVTFAPLILFEF